MFLDKLKYQKPLFHSSFLWIGFFTSSLLIIFFLYNIVYTELILIFIFISFSINSLIFFNILTPFFYSKKYEIEGIDKFTVYKRCDFVTISFSGELLHNEFIPAFLKGYEVTFLGINKDLFNMFRIVEYYNNDNDTYSEFFILNHKIKNLKNVKNVYDKFNVKNKITQF